MSWLDRSLADKAAAVRRGELRARDLLALYQARIAAIDPQLGAYLTQDPRAADHADAVDAAVQAGRDPGPLAGVPIGLKDLIVTAGVPTTAGSRILGEWRPPYDATVVTRLRAAGAVVLGKLNCDEFGMGSATEFSARGTTANPWDLTRVPGGSSGGSAAAVAAGLCAVSLGTDTGGSIRQPAAFCGAVGLKPTYGRVSRWGLIAYASSLDQIGPIGRTVDDVALTLEVIAGACAHDATSLDHPLPDLRAAARAPLAGLRVGVLPDDGATALAPLDPAVAAGLARARAALVEAGAHLVEVTVAHADVVVPTYYLIATVEAASNLARYDGLRFGVRAEGASLAEVLERTRGDGFGPEVKRRILLGTFASRAGYYDAYYDKAQRVRRLIQAAYATVFTTCDVLLTPVAPTPAWPRGADVPPWQTYLADRFTLGPNLAGLPAMAVPVGQSDGGLPIGVQLVGPLLGEAAMVRAAGGLERGCGLAPWPPLAQVST